MAAPLEDATHEEQRSMIRFLVAEGVKPSEVYRTMSVQYGTKEMYINGSEDLKKGSQVSKMSPEGLQR